MRDRAVQEQGETVESDVKTGVGGIRDVEFLVQALQLMNAAAYPDLLGGNTLQALDLIEEHGLLDVASARKMRNAYILLRRVEHSLQIMEDRQTHTLPDDQIQRRALARRVMGPDADEHALEEELAGVQKVVRSIFEHTLAP